MLNVLLVDDEKLERVLIRKGYNWEENGFNIVGEAASGEDALEYINYHNVDIVITDINMPGMDGLQFTEKLLQKNPKCRCISYVCARCVADYLSGNKGLYRSTLQHGIKC